MTVFHFLPREMKLAPFPLLAKKKLPKGIEIVDSIFWLHVKEWILLHGEIIVTSHFPFLIFFNYDIKKVKVSKNQQRWKTFYRRDVVANEVDGPKS